MISKKGCEGEAPHGPRSARHGSFYATVYCNSALILKFASLPVDGVGVTTYSNSALILISFQAGRYGWADYVNNNTFQ